MRLLHGDIMCVLLYCLLAGDADVLFEILQAAKKPLVCMGMWRFAG